MTVLLFGATGQVGTEILALADAEEFDVRGIPRDEADLAKPDELEELIINNADIDLVINAAAYTAVDKAEEEEELAYRVNAIVPRLLARACVGRSIPFVMVSTDFVFDGTKGSAYVEQDPPRPIGASTSSSNVLTGLPVKSPGSDFCHGTI